MLSIYLYENGKSIKVTKASIIRGLHNINTYSHVIFVKTEGGVSTILNRVPVAEMPKLQETLEGILQA